MGSVFLSPAVCYTSSCGACGGESCEYSLRHIKKVSAPRNRGAETNILVRLVFLQDNFLNCITLLHDVDATSGILYSETV